MLKISYILLSIAFFGSVKEAVFPLPNKMAIIRELAYPEELKMVKFKNVPFDNVSLRTRQINVPAFKIGLYRSYDKHDGTVKRKFTKD